MLYELITYELKPRTLPQVEAMLGDAYERLGRPEEMIGSFRTEFGPLNQAIQIWRYDDMAHFERFGGRNGPPVAAADHILAVSNQLMTPTSISPELKPGKLGPYYELRTYEFPVGILDKLTDAWRRAMPARDALGSPVAAIWTARVGGLNSLTHIWPYASLDEREEIRKQVRVGGMWPPYKLDEAEGGSGYDIVRQQNKLMLPAAFSPLQ